MRPNAPFQIRKRWLLAGTAGILTLALGLWVADEIDSSRLQASQISAYAATLTYETVEGASTAIRFPTHGPFDERMGYRRLPELSQRLTAAGYTLSRQARLSTPLLNYVDQGYFPPYRE